MIELTGTISDRQKAEQLLDNMDIERERGITIKASAVTMDYQYEGKTYMLNLIDTPGHVDFHYEVSRALAACEGGLLVVDASQGVEAQTVANTYLAIENNVELLSVINKVDLPAADTDLAAEEINHIIGVGANECFKVSAKSGLGVEELLEAIVTFLPAPEDKSDQPTAAMIFDSHCDQYRGVICYVRVFAGSLKVKQKVSFMRSGRTYIITELGKFKPEMTAVDELGTGEVGYVIANIRELADVTIGDTITDYAKPASEALPGYKPPIQMVFALNDASFSFSPQNSPALGFGFRCGFLGLLHMEIVQERLERENDIEVVQTAPTVSYEVVTRDGTVKRIESPGQLPDPSHIEELREPFARLEIITGVDSIGGIMKLADSRRCKLVKTDYLSSTRVMLEYNAPLAEIVYDFYDLLKGISRGYATMDYEFTGFVAGDLVKIDILVNKVAVDALSLIVHRSKAETRGRKLIIKLRRAIPPKT